MRTAGIHEGKDDYHGFPEGTDLSGKVAVCLRFEPMDENGKSRWARRRWSSKAGFNGKLKAIAGRGAAAVLIVNTPGADDPRVDRDALGTEPLGDRGGARLPMGAVVVGVTGDEQRLGVDAPPFVERGKAGPPLARGGAAGRARAQGEQLAQSQADCAVRKEGAALHRGVPVAARDRAPGTEALRGLEPRGVPAHKEEYYVHRREAGPARDAGP